MHFLNQLLYLFINYMHYSKDIIIKKTMRKLILMLVALVCVAVHANDKFGYLAFADKNGEIKTISVEGLKLTIVGGELVAQNADTKESFSLADLSKMYFSKEAQSGIENIDIKNNGKVTIYSTGGVKIGEFENIGAAQKHLDTGVYVVKSEKLTYKFVVR